MNSTPNGEASHLFLMRALLAHGAIPCAESSAKVPLRQSHDDEDGARKWLSRIGGFGTVWEQYGIWHSCAAPSVDLPGGVIVPPSARLVCIDVDVDACRQTTEPCHEPGCKHANGLAELAELTATLGDLPETIVTRSPRGGVHIWYVLPAGYRVSGSGKIQGKQGLDCKGNGGAYVGEFNYGRQLLTGAAAVADLPSAWLLALPKPGTTTATPAARGVDGTRPVDADWRDWCALVDPAVDGAGGGLAVKLLGKRAGEHEYVFEEALAEALATYNPRCVPPFSESEFRKRFGEWYDPGARAEAEAFCAEVFAGFVIEPAALTWSPVPTSVRTSLLAVTPAPTPGYPIKPTLAVLAKYYAHNPRWSGKLRWDLFASTVRGFDCDLGQGPMNGRALVDSDVTALQIHFGQCFQHEPSKEMMVQSLHYAAHEHEFHPVRTYLDACYTQAMTGDPITPEGARAEIARCFDQVLGERAAIEHAFLRKTMLAAARRVLEPGCKVDTVLLFIGDQGLYKSTFFRDLFGRDWFSDSKINLEQKDAAINLLGVWCTELAELASLKRDQVELTRQFISSAVDRFRAPYDRIASDHPRQGVLVGSSNEIHVLTDPEGNRRFWPLLVGDYIDLPVLTACRDRLWGLVMLLEKAGEPHWLSREEEPQAALHRSAFEVQDEWAEPLSEAARGQETVKVPGLLMAAFDLTLEHAHNPGNTRRAARVLRMLGFRYVKSHGERHWKVPAHIAEMPVKASAWNMPKLL